MFDKFDGQITILDVEICILSVDIKIHGQITIRWPTYSQTNIAKP